MVNKIELNGTIYFEPPTKKWIGSGFGWWVEPSGNDSARVYFAEPIAYNSTDPLTTNNYSILITSVNPGNAIVFDADENGFSIQLSDYTDISCIVSFKVTGIKSNYVPNDRELSTEESVEDVHALSLLFDYEAKYGVVTVMGSASIKSGTMAAERIKQLSSGMEKINAYSLKETKEYSHTFLDHKKKLADIKIERQKLIVAKSSKYWHSARKFGQLWGHYAAHQQESALHGCYVPICTGGGPGIMQAVADGARSENAHVIGIDCQFGNDQFFDVTSDHFSILSNMRLRLNNFSIREGVLINNSHVILFWPGGYGTTWEVCETLSKIQTMHLRKRRVKAIFVHREFWEPFFKLVDHFRSYGTVNSYGDRIKIPGVDDDLPDDAYLAEVVDTPEEAFDKTKDFIEELFRKNLLILTGA